MESGKSAQGVVCGVGAAAYARNQCRVAAAERAIAVDVAQISDQLDGIVARDGNGAAVEAHAAQWSSPVVL